MTRLATATALAALLGLATSSPVQAEKSAKNAKSATSAKAKATSKGKASKTTLPKTKDYDFMADEIDGDRVLPNLDRILGVGDSKHASLIRLREHFIPEIIRSADLL